uniref:Uncharacterized protein n=1 Tax=Pristionchus pacificus TaxID=54126 RepID=A0A2A6BFR4_PRIPA|eukprot:PDM64722.1 hypothetical protein PRIPAC_52978 [Pristionchus pacificus]
MAIKGQKSTSPSVLSAARREWRPLFIKWTRHGVPWGLDLSAVLGPSFPNRMPRPHLEGGLGP